MLTALVVGSAVLALPVMGSAATPGNPPEPDKEQRPPSDGANFTIIPDDPTPDTGTAYTMLSKGVGPWNGSDGLQEIDYYKITTQDTRFRDCSPSDAQAFGIDRDNDDPGTATDTGLLRHMRDYSVDGRVIAVTIYDEEDLGGDPTHLNDTDETVAKLANCVVTPSEPGWYQFKGYVNGTNYDGKFQEVLLYSKYFYVCDCSSEAEAREQLGPRPYSDTDSGDSGSDGGDTDASTATPTATPAPDDGGTESTVTATATATPTATATLTATVTTTPGQAAGQGDGSDGETATADDSGGDGGVSDGGAGDGGSGSSAATSTASGGGDQQAGGSGGQAGGRERRTPTAGDGSGFGLLAALGGLLLTGLLARRDD
ncbi:hypothetical protein BRC89_03745 [Halobacteriales archaeon QS_4_70_19]|nr:MAG: hypothetical protein BRC89_03745 [Halobacteriales archaeon QS_4_70_19]